MSNMTIEKFWFVWSPSGSNPRHRHDSPTSAKAEASRLAGLNPGTEFVVLESIGSALRSPPPPPPVQWSEHIDLPF